MRNRLWVSRGRECYRSTKCSMHQWAQSLCAARDNGHMMMTSTNDITSFPHWPFRREADGARRPKNAQALTAQNQVMYTDSKNLSKVWIADKPWEKLIWKPAEWGAMNANSKPKYLWDYLSVWHCLRYHNAKDEIRTDSYENMWEHYVTTFRVSSGSEIGSVPVR